MDTESFDGQIALIRVYNSRVLTAQEVADNFDAVRFLNPIQFSSLSVSNITDEAADIYAAVNTNLTDATLVWDTSDRGTVSTNNWAYRLGLGAQSAGSVGGRATGLSGDTLYCFRFYGEIGSSNGWSSVGMFTTPLTNEQAPVFSTASALSSFSVMIEWQDNANFETGYILQRSTTEGSGDVTIATLGADTTAYTDSGRAMDTTYYYQLYATNTVNKSGTDPALCRTSVATPLFPGADTTLFYDDFDGSGTAYLNGTTPDITSGGAQWLAMHNATNGRIYDDGRIDVSGGASANRGGSATLAFLPKKGYVYTLDLSAVSLNSTASHTTAGRLYFGFARGQSANNGTGYRLSPSDATVQGQVIQIFNVKQGYTGANDLWEYSANDTSLARWIGWAGGYGGNIDLRVVLDTRVTGNWTATWYARRPSYPEWLETRAAETVTDTDITSVGFGLNTYTSGRISSFKLTAEYKPAGTIILLR